jgi:hypothetical protein
MGKVWCGYCTVTTGLKKYRMVIPRPTNRLQVPLIISLR